MDPHALRPILVLGHHPLSELLEMVRGSRGHIHTGKDYEVKVHKECTIWGHLYRGGQPASFWGKYYTDNIYIVYCTFIEYCTYLY